MKRTVAQRQDLDSDESFEESADIFTKEQVEAEGRTYIKMPRKTNFRMHAHINPFNPLNCDHPINSRFVDWSVHYPLFYGINDNNKNKIVVNTKKNPMPGSYATLSQKEGPTPSILDIGCGYGGLMFQLTKGFPE